MFRVAIVGASSLSLGKKIIDEILQEFREVNLELRLMSMHEEHVRLVAGYARRFIQSGDADIRIRIGRSSREVIDGADAVITVFDIGGHQAGVMDHEIAGEFGIGQCIGDTLGPGAVMRSQRVIPVIRRLHKEMTELSPDGLLINYVNPLGPVGIALDRLGRNRSIGMCSGPVEMMKSIGEMLDVEPLRYRLAGTNHMSWLLSLTDDKGTDMYPELKRRILHPDIAGKERARAEILRTYGYFCSESSGQLTDMLPWFRNSGRSREAYLGRGYAGETGAYPKVNGFLHRHLGRMDFLEHAVPDIVTPRNSSLSRILEHQAGLERKGHTSPVIGNVINRDCRIGNLPPSACVETTLIQESGHWIPEHKNPIPLEVLPLSRRHNENNEMMASAALSGDPDILVRTMCLDPVTSANIGINEIREMTRRYIEAEREWLPQYDGKAVFPGVDIGRLPQIDKTVLDGESFVETVRRRKPDRSTSG